MDFQTLSVSIRDKKPPKISIHSQFPQELFLLMSQEAENLTCETHRIFPEYPNKFKRSFK